MASPSSNFTPVVYKTNYVFASIVALSTIPSTTLMIFGANMLRRDLHFDFFLVFIAGATITIFNILILIQKNYLLQGNLYLKCWPFLVLLATGLFRFLQGFWTGRFDDGSGFSVAVVSAIVYIFYVHSSMFRPYRLKSLSPVIPTFVALGLAPPAYQKS